MKRGCCLLILVILVMFGVYVWNLFRVVPLRISPETTVVTEPLTSDGRTIDFFAVLEAHYPEGMKTEKNSAREILRQLGPGKYVTKRFQTILAEIWFQEDDRPATEAEFTENYCSYYEKLGLEPISPDTEPKIGFVPPREAFPMWLEAQFPEQNAEFEARKERFEATSCTEYLTVEPEFVRAWVTENSPALDAVAEAVKEAEFCKFPYHKISETATYNFLLYPEMENVWGIAYGFCMCATLRAVAGDMDGAVADYVACMTLAHQLQNGAFFYSEWEQARNVKNLAKEMPFIVNPAENAEGNTTVKPYPTLTAEQWEKIQSVAENPNQEEKLKRILETGERLKIANAVQFFSLQPKENWMPLLFGEGENGKMYMFGAGVDWNEVARELYQLQTEVNARNDRAYCSMYDSLIIPLPWYNKWVSRTYRNRLMGMAMTTGLGTCNPYCFTRVRTIPELRTEAEKEEDAKMDLEEEW